MERTTKRQAERLSAIEEDLGIKFEDYSYKMPRRIKSLFKKYWVTQFDVDDHRTNNPGLSESSTYCSIKSILYIIAKAEWLGYSKDEVIGFSTEELNSGLFGMISSQLDRFKSVMKGLSVEYVHQQQDAHHISYSNTHGLDAARATQTSLIELLKVLLECYSDDYDFVWGF